MTRSESLAFRLREMLLEGRWIANTNYRELIADLDWEQATFKVETLNTVAALVFHVDYYLTGLIQVLDGGPLAIRDKYSFDMPPVRSEADWQSLKTDFLAHAERFSEQVGELPDAVLDEVFVDAKYGTYLRNIEAVIEHGYYHMGQISLVRKLVLAGS